MDSKKKIYAIIIIFLLGAVFLIVFAITPLLEEIIASSKEFFSIKQSTAIIREKIEQTSGVKQEFLALETSLEKIRTLFVNSEMPVGFLQFLEETAKSNNLSINISYTSQGKEESSTFPFLGFRLVTSGSFPNSWKFLRKLETSSYLLEIQDLVIRHLTENQLRQEDYRELSISDVELSLSIKIFINDSINTL